MSLRIRIVSDLHLEFGPMELPYIGEDLLILAGDVTSHLAPSTWFVELLKFRNVLYVLGNHEFYNSDIKKELGNLPRLEGSINRKAIQLGYSGRIRCVNNEVIVGNGVAFICSTLWSHIPIDKESLVRNALNDFRLIKYDEVILTPSKMNEMNKESAAFLESSLYKHRDKMRVVVTHHSPSLLGCVGKYKDSDLNCCFHNSLDYLVEKSNIWIHGHTHESLDYSIGNSRVICNPRGYSGFEINSSFNPNLLIGLS